MKANLKLLWLVIFVFAGLFLTACSDNPKSANGNFVKASLEVQEALKHYNDGDYAAALASVDKIEKSLNEILVKYPQSEIALKLVSDESLRVGYMRYADFRDVFAPEVASLSVPVMAPFASSWAIAFSDKSKRSENVLRFANCLVYYNLQISKLKERALSPKKIYTKEELGPIITKCFEEIENPQMKASLSSSIETAVELYELSKKAKTAESPRKIANKKIFLKVENSEKFLADAKKEAVRITYNMDASGALLKTADIAAMDPQVIPPFLEILQEAASNAVKISTAKQRNMALSNIILSMLKVDASDAALKAVASIEGDDNLKSICLEKIAHSFALNNNFDAAINIAKGFQASPLKNAMILKFIKDITLSGLYDKAAQVALKLEDPSTKTAALFYVASMQWQSNSAAALASLKTIDPNLLQENFLVDFCVNAKIDFLRFSSSEGKLVSASLAIADKIADSDKETAKVWQNFISKNFAKVTDDRELGSLVRPFCSLLLKLGKTSDYQDFVSDLMLKANPQTLFYSLSDLGLEAQILGHADLAEFFFYKASVLCKSFAKDRESSAIYLSMQMNISGFDSHKGAAILKDFLPKFKL